MQVLGGNNGEQGKSEAVSPVITCPTCRTPTSLPPGGVTKLQVRPSTINLFNFLSKQFYSIQHSVQLFVCESYSGSVRGKHLSQVEFHYEMDIAIYHLFPSSNHPLPEHTHTRARARAHAHHTHTHTYTYTHTLHVMHSLRLCKERRSEKKLEAKEQTTLKHHLLSHFFFPPFFFFFFSRVFSDEFLPG